MGTAAFSPADLAPIRMHHTCLNHTGGFELPILCTCLACLRVILVRAQYLHTLIRIVMAWNVGSATWRPFNFTGIGKKRVVSKL